MNDEKEVIEVNESATETNESATETKEQITPDELQAISNAVKQKNDAALKAENAKLQHQLLVQHIFIKYGLSFHDKIDDVTGEITRNSVKESGNEA